LDEEITKAIDNDITLFAYTFVIIIILTNAFLFRCNAIQSKTWLALFSVISIIMALISSMGVMAICGIKWNVVVGAGALLLLGIGYNFVVVFSFFVVVVNISNSYYLLKNRHGSMKFKKIYQ
jgi:predicted RND superfamily exporter protein